mgnify:CR=1 FL=1
MAGVHYGGGRAAGRYKQLSIVLIKQNQGKERVKKCVKEKKKSTKLKHARRPDAGLEAVESSCCDAPASTASCPDSEITPRTVSTAARGNHGNSATEN